MIIATHEMSFAREVADEVCFLHEGLILERGAPEQVLSEPQTARGPALSSALSFQAEVRNPAGAWMLTMRTRASPSLRKVWRTPGGTSTNVPGPATLLALDAERELALEDVERIVLRLVQVLGRAAAVRLDLDHGEVETRCVGAPREELDVADAVALARPDDDSLHDPRF